MGFRNLTRQQAASRESLDDETQKARADHAQPNFAGGHGEAMTPAQAMHLQRTIGNKATIEVLRKQHEVSSIEHTTSSERVQRGFFDRMTGKKKKKSSAVGPSRPTTPAPTTKPDNFDAESESEQEIKPSGAPLSTFMVANPLGQENSGNKGKRAIGKRNNPKSGVQSNYMPWDANPGVESHYTPWVPDHERTVLPYQPSNNPVPAAPSIAPENQPTDNPVAALSNQPDGLPVSENGENTAPAIVPAPQQPLTRNSLFDGHTAEELEKLSKEEIKTLNLTLAQIHFLWSSEFSEDGLPLDMVKGLEEHPVFLAERAAERAAKKAAKKIKKAAKADKRAAQKETEDQRYLEEVAQQEAVQAQWDAKLKAGQLGTYYSKANKDKWTNPADAESLMQKGTYKPRHLSKDHGYDTSEKNTDAIYGGGAQNATWRGPVYGSNPDKSIKNNGLGALPVKYIRNQAELDSYELKLNKDTRQFYWRGKVVDTSKFQRLLSAPGAAGGGAAIFVMTLSGKIYIANEAKETVQAIGPHNQQDWRFNHSTLVAGEAVAAAGELKFEKGSLVSVTDSSGHYRPQPQHTFQLLEHFEANGINVDDVNVSLYEEGMGATVDTYKNWKKSSLYTQRNQ